MPIWQVREEQCMLRERWGASSVLAPLAEEEEHLLEGEGVIKHLMTTTLGTRGNRSLNPLLMRLRRAMRRLGKRGIMTWG
jgi:hypothetical protein